MTAMPATYRKYPHCPWSTAQIRERVAAKIIAEFGHRRGYERMGRSDREIVAKATAWEAISEHVENARRYDPGTESMIVTSEMIRDTQAAIFDAFGLRDDEET